MQTQGLARFAQRVKLGQRVGEKTANKWLEAEAAANKWSEAEAAANKWSEAEATSLKTVREAAAHNLSKEYIAH